MDKEQLSRLEPFFDGWYLDNVIDQNATTTLYRVKKVLSDTSVGFRHMTVETMLAPPPHGDGDNPEDIKLKLLELDIMQKMKNCPQVVSYYDSTAIYNGNGEYSIISMRESVKLLSDEYDIHDLPIFVALRTVISVCDAVSQFRSMGITHENINFENIFIDNSGNFKLGSFVNVGTSEDCKAPEEYKSGADISQSDMYRLGMLLYKAFSKNRAAFLPEYPTQVTSENLSNALRRRLGGEVPNAPENAPDGINEIIKKACAFKPSDRYQNLGSIKRDIEDILSQIDPTYVSLPPKVDIYPYGQPVPKTQLNNKEEPDDEEEEVVIKDDTPTTYSRDYDTSKEESGKVIKGLITAIVAVTLLSVLFLVYAFLGTGSEPATTARQTTTTQPSTTAPTTQPTTAQPTTTQPTTTLPSTTEATVPPVPSEETTKPEVSTTTITTQPSTTTTQPKPEYISVENPKFELIENEGRVEEILVFADATFGKQVTADGEVLLYTYDESGSIVKTQTMSVDCYYDEDNDDITICDIIVPSDIDIDTDNYKYEIYIPKDIIRGSDSKNESFAVEF